MQEANWMQILRDVVHDLKAPLSSIKILIDGMEEVGDLNPKQQYFAERARLKLVQMTHMLNTVMDMAWIDSDHPLNLAPVDVAVVIHKQVSLLEDVAAQRQIDVRVNAPERSAPIEADERMISQIVLNLLSNAIKYNNDNGYVDIQLRDESDQVVLVVEDCGRGIPLSDQPHVFERFFRSKGVSKVEGTGLGLAIVKTAIDRHYGRVTLESESDKGTTFTVILPRRHSPLAEKPERATRELPRAKATGETARVSDVLSSGDETIDAVDDRIQESQDASEDIADAHAGAGRQQAKKSDE